MPDDGIASCVARQSTARPSRPSRDRVTRRKARSFVHLFTNRWLWAAVAGSLALQLLIVYVPVLQRAFGTAGLSAGDWAFCVAVASVVLWVREGSKLIARANALKANSR